MNQFSKLAVLGLTLSLAACSLMTENKVEYQSSGKAPSLDVPPDLTQLSRENRYAIPGGTVTASGYEAAKPSQSVPVAASALSDVRIERAGNQRWLVVARPADQLWDSLRDFWQENGFLLAMDQNNLGIMETDWAENRAKIPQDFIRNAIGKMFDSLYSTGERDKFRTRLERTASGGTEIYISHRGMVEVYNSADKNATVWQPRPADPELEAEFLRRMMVKLGVAQEQAKSLIATGPGKTRSTVSTINGVPVVQMPEGFDSAWRRVGLSLDRTGFTVEDRDRSQGTYFVRYVEPNSEKSEPGFFSKLLSSTAKGNAPLKYRVVVRSTTDASVVSVLNVNGTPEASASAERIVKVLADDLK